VTKIVCEIGVFDKINGIEFEPRQAGGCVSKSDVPDELLEQFLSVPGYVVDEDKKPAQQPAARARQAKTPETTQQPTQQPTPEAPAGAEGEQGTGLKA
jgi:hypothetical protein